ncbi:hypothetical protein FGIG_11063 [Fasciola gigantica]|uniref:Uncharacterized protein n=1 Tax=Fasciola gigantica TaxID=46835 RepID=A0A504YPW6_FASGI|nr:hypothetical protein FGIG_11063 [Fasciola gigantica]
MQLFRLNKHFPWFYSRIFHSYFICFHVQSASVTTTCLPGPPAP